MQNCNFVKLDKSMFLFPGPPFASVDLVTPETHTPTVYLILAPAVPVAREPSARIMVVLLSVSVLPAMSVIHMFLAGEVYLSSKSCISYYFICELILI